MSGYKPHSTEAMRRWRRPEDGDTRPDGLERLVEPAPQPWPCFPYLALVLCLGFLALQLYPATHWRHPMDPYRTWHPHPKRGDKADAVTSINRDEFYGTLEELQVQQAEDLASQQEEQQSHGKGTNEFLKRANNQEVHIFLCTDDPDFRPIGVLINSTILNAKHPERIHFHLVLPPKLRSRVKLLNAFFGNVNIEIPPSEAINMQEVEEHISFRNSSKTRTELKSPYNFLPFFLPHYFNGIDRIIYLDTDIVVKGNIEELLHVNLDGRAVAAVEDCSQKLETYFDFAQLKTIQAREEKPAWVPKEPIDPQTCVFNRGVLVIDTKHWLQENLTEAITWWMDQFQSADKVLYKYGLSQPPFLLSLYGKYEKLPGPWNVRGLGRQEFSDQEREYMFKAYGSKPDKQPFLSPHADVAKILHFNGKYKPWKTGRPVGQSTTAVSRCGPNGQNCAELWWEYAGDLMDTVLANLEDDTDIPLEG